MEGKKKHTGMKKEKIDRPKQRHQPEQSRTGRNVKDNPIHNREWLTNIRKRQEQGIWEDSKHPPQGGAAGGV